MHTLTAKTVYQDFVPAKCEGTETALRPNTLNILIFKIYSPITYAGRFPCLKTGWERNCKPRNVLNC